MARPGNQLARHGGTSVAHDGNMRARRRTLRQRIAVATLLMLGTLPGTGLHAQQNATQTTFQAKAWVQAVCEVTATDLDFGTYTSKTGTRLDSQTLLRATCTPGTTYNVGLNEGTTAGASITETAASGTGLAVDHPVFGAVPNAQVIPAGDYSDTITVRVYY